MSTKRRVYRKGSTLASISTEPVDGVIRALAVDEPQHKLYVMSKQSLYRQANVTENQLALSKLVDIPYPNGLIPGAQTLNLPDIKNSAIIGTGYAELFQVEDKDPGASIKQLAGPSASIVHSTLDPADNILYFADNLRGFSIYYTKYGQSQKPKFATFEQAISLNDMKVATYKGKVYAAGSYAGLLKGSKLFIWSGNANTGQMKEVAIDENTSPFKKAPKGNKIASLFFTRQGNLYATGSNGVLYCLHNRETQQPYWEVVTNTTSPYLSDNAVDANGNIYLSSDSGVWKVPFDNPSESYRLNNYDSYISAIVVDNNR